MRSFYPTSVEAVAPLPITAEKGRQAVSVSRSQVTYVAPSAWRQDQLEADLERRIIASVRNIEKNVERAERSVARFQETLEKMERGA